LGELSGVPSYLIDGAANLDPAWFEGVQTVLVTAGASAPEAVVNECIEWTLQRFPGVEVEPAIVRHEDVSFPLPKVLRGITVGSLSR
jgi:4-hydroxy-3-methylbut-2-enyl diphosphate reductase